MSIIKIENLSFAYPGSYDNVFENLNLQLDTDWRLGLIGRNGKGKTTLLRLLQGELEPRGRIIASVSFAYFPYPVAEPQHTAESVLREVCPQAADWKLMRELSLLEVKPEALLRPFASLSKGEQTKLLLAGLFLNEERFLLIDEPTNHLDAAGRRLVAAYLKRKRGFILVSHDRVFLDSCIDHVLALNHSTVTVQSGNFSSWQQNFRQQQEHEAAQNKRLEQEISSLQRASRRTANWSDRVEASKAGAYDKGYVGHKAAKMMQRAKNLASRRQQAIREKSALLHDLERNEELKMFPLSYRSEVLAELNQAAPCYGDRPVCRPVSFSVSRGERLLLAGRNGCGKSSLLKLLLDQSLPHSGQVSLGSGLQISYVSQDTSGLQGDLRTYAAARGLDETLFKTVLRKLDLPRRQFTKDMADFSEGQKKKVLLAASLCQPAHLFIWDEPLNFIDIYSRIQLEELIRRFSPTMVFAEHDAGFCQAVATNVIQL